MPHAFLALCVLLTAACVHPSGEGTAPRLPGLPVAAQGESEGPVHLQEVLGVSAEGVLVRERLTADGHPQKERLLLIDRQGEGREAAGGPPADSAPALPLPLEVGGLTLAAERQGGDWVVRLGEPGAPKARWSVLARLPRAGDLTLGPVHLGPEAPPTLAALTWSSGRGAIRIQGVRVLDLRRGRAHVALLGGLEAHRASRFEAAAAAFAEALAIDPEYADAAYDLAAAYARLGQPERALVFLDRALELDPARLRVVAASDPDLDTLRKEEAFRELVGPGATLRRR